jgi:hypothetical protein
MLGIHRERPYGLPPPLVHSNYFPGDHRLLAELTEELGLPANAAVLSGPLCIVEHPGSHVCDLGLAMQSSLSGEDS